MLHIVVLGAGRSAGYFIEYMFHLCATQEWKLTIADQHTEHLDSLFSRYTNAHLVKVDVTNATERESLISEANWVVSMLPAFMHTIVAKDCLRLGVNMATASYESDEMRAIRPEIESKGLQFINECGLDQELTTCLPCKSLIACILKEPRLLHLNRIVVVWLLKIASIILGDINLVGIQEM